MGRDWDSGVKSGMAGLRRIKGGKAGFENPYCGSSMVKGTLILAHTGNCISLFCCCAAR